jgi:DNA replication protein DnaC
LRIPQASNRNLRGIAEAIAATSYDQAHGASRLEGLFLAVTYRAPRANRRARNDLVFRQNTILCRVMPRLLEELELAHGDGHFPRLFRSITKAQLLILDDWGPDRLTATQRRDLMELVEERYGRGSSMITSQLPIKAWHDVIGEPTLADAILDRIVHNSYRLELEGQSKRKKKRQNG